MRKTKKTAFIEHLLGAGNCAEEWKAQSCGAGVTLHQQVSDIITGSPITSGFKNSQDATQRDSSSARVWKRPPLVQVLCYDSHLLEKCISNKVFLFIFNHCYQIFLKYLYCFVNCVLELKKKTLSRRMIFSAQNLMIMEFFK